MNFHYLKTPVKILVKIPVLLFFILFMSCEQKPQPVVFPVRGLSMSVNADGTDGALFGMNGKASEGVIYLTKPEKLEYYFSSAPVIDQVLAGSPARAGEPVSLEIEYSLSPPESSFRFVLNIGIDAWVLPTMPLDGINSGGAVFHYAVPVANPLPMRFSVALEDGDYKNLPGVSAESAFRIHSIEFKKRWFGFSRESGGRRLFVSPFVSNRPGDSPGDSVWIMDIPAVFFPDGLHPELSAALRPGSAAFLDTGNFIFEALPRLEKFYISAGLTPPDASVSIRGDRTASLRLSYAKIPVFPAAITADPGMALSWPRENWRDKRYEVFRWEAFPSLLIFDTADYAAQERLFKRLAFYVEKAGYRGRLLSDREIAGLHGWNAHDYRAEDLARFFQAARRANFPLLAEERELERILIDNGIIKNSGGVIQAGDGGVISISRESPDYLRNRFMAHEGYHGIFFIDDDFRAFSRERWRQLSEDAKRFIISYFDYQGYDTADEYLLVNEFMAHIMQQTVSLAGVYFGQTLPSIIENIPWRRASLPAKSPYGNWPSLASALTAEARAFSSHAESRWGLAAGRVHLVTVKRQ